MYCILGKFISQTFELLIGVHLTGMHLSQACVSQECTLEAATYVPMYISLDPLGRCVVLGEVITCPLIGPASVGVSKGRAQQQQKPSVFAAGSQVPGFNK
jgi:hypothetical protein